MDDNDDGDLFDDEDLEIEAEDMDDIQFNQAESKRAQEEM